MTRIEKEYNRIAEYGCQIDEVNTAFCVLEAWLDIRRGVQERRNEKKKSRKR